jgi:hypothetical protein
MKNINHSTKTTFLFSKVLFLIVLFSSFTPYNPRLSSCQHDFELKDSYSVNRPERVIIKALKEYGFDVKRGLLEDFEDDSSPNHNWRLLNVRTKYGMVKEITIQIRIEGTDTFPSTRVSLVRMCLNDELTERELKSRIKKYRSFFKKDIISKLKKYKG